MSNELVKIDNNQGGYGLENSSRLFKVKPATISITQKSSTAEDAVPGKLRIADINKSFDSVEVFLLSQPREQRAFYIGDKEQLNRIPENKMCGSSDVLRGDRGEELQGPDSDVKLPQSLKCSACSKSSWAKWQASHNKADIPACESHYFIQVLDTELLMPLNMYVRSKSKNELEAGMSQVARLLEMAKARGKNPSLFDVKFTLRTKRQTSGQFSYYVLEVTDVKYVNQEEHVRFSEAFFRHNTSFKQSEPSNTEPTSNTPESVSSLIESGEYLDNDIVI